MTIFDSENGSLALISKLIETYDAIYRAGWGNLSDYDMRKQNLKSHYTNMDKCIEIEAKRNQIWNRFEEITGKLFT